jgi:hypothetical protein
VENRGISGEKAAQRRNGLGILEKGAGKQWNELGILGNGRDDGGKRRDLRGTPWEFSGTGRDFEEKRRALRA